MKKKLIAISLVAMLGLSGCGIDTGSESSESSTSATEAATEEVTTEAVTEEETTEAETEAPTEEETTEAATEEETEEATKDEEKKSSGSSAPSAVEGLSSKYADLDNRSFAYNGKVFTVGVTTFQELVDGGVDFKESDLNNLDNNLNPNHSTEWYTIKISDYSSIQLQFTNFGEENIKEKDCPLAYARWYTIHVPRYDDEKRNEDAREDLERAAQIVSFAFPLTLTKDDLLANSPDYTEYKEGFNEYSYTVESEKYYGGSGYRFDFDKDIQQLSDVYITWMP